MKNKFGGDRTKKPQVTRVTWVTLVTFVTISNEINEINENITRGVLLI